MKEYGQEKRCHFPEGYFADETFIERLTVSKRLYNTCTFSCNTCNRRYSTWHGFKTHLNYCRANFEKPLTKYIVQGLSNKCDKCTKMLLCDTTTVRNHMKNVHKHSMDDDEKANIKTKSQYDNLCKSIIKSVPISTTIWRKRVLPMSEIPLREATSMIGNLCQFTCPKCNLKNFSSWNKLNKHYNRVHGTNVSYSYKIVSVARCHTCLICPKAMLCDRYIILQHLSSAHKMKITKYEKILLRNGGKTLPTFDAWMTADS